MTIDRDGNITSMTIFPRELKSDWARVWAYIGDMVVYRAIRARDPRIIDRWQKEPVVFTAVMRARETAGMFLRKGEDINGQG